MVHRARTHGKSRHRRDRRQRHLRARRPGRREGGRRQHAVRDALGRVHPRPPGRRGAGVPRPPRARPRHPAARGQLPRQHLRHEDAGRGVAPVTERGRLHARGHPPRRSGRRRPVLRSHRRAGQHLLRRRRGRARELRRPGQPGPVGPPLRGRGRAGQGGRRRRARAPRRHLHGDQRPAVLHPRRVEHLPQARHRRHRHDRAAGGQAGPRGGDELRHPGAQHRLRLLAPGRGGGDGRGGGRHHAQERGPGPPDRRPRGGAGPGAARLHRVARAGRRDHDRQEADPAGGARAALGHHRKVRYHDICRPLAPGRRLGRGRRHRRAVRPAARSAGRLRLVHLRGGVVLHAQGGAGRRGRRGLRPGAPRLLPRRAASTPAASSGGRARPSAGPGATRTT